jgi:hypothetical protein
MSDRPRRTSGQGRVGPTVRMGRRRVLIASLEVNVTNSKQLEPCDSGIPYRNYHETLINFL